MNNKWTIEINKYYIPFIVIFLFTLLNGYYNSILLAYGVRPIYPLCSFLFNANDLHADLIKFSLSFNDKIIDISDWLPIYKSFYNNNPYGGLDALKAGQLTNLIAFPPYASVGILTSRILMYYPPRVVLICVYSIVSLLTFLTVNFFNKKNGDKSSLLLTIMMLMSYVFLFILSRGHCFSFIIFLLLTFFIYAIMTKSNNYFILILLFSVAFCFRPNMAILGILFFRYGFKKGILLSITAVLTSLLLLLLSFEIINIFYHDYTFLNFIKGLKIYNAHYVIGTLGTAFNNSLFGAIKILLINTMGISSLGLTYKTISTNLSYINIITAFLLIQTLLFSLFLYYKKYIRIFDFIFITVSIYTLISSVFTTYHLAIFYVFLLLPLLLQETIQSKYLKVIVVLSIFMLMPKNYFYISNSAISYETILNPLVLLIGIMYIIINSYFKNENENIENLEFSTVQD